MYLAFQVFTTARVAANFITYGVIGLAGFGVALPVLYTVVARRRPLADLGITTSLLRQVLIARKTRLLGGRRHLALRPWPAALAACGALS